MDHGTYDSQNSVVIGNGSIKVVSPEPGFVVRAWHSSCLMLLEMLTLGSKEGDICEDDIYMVAPEGPQRGMPVHIGRGKFGVAKGATRRLFRRSECDGVLGLSLSYVIWLSF
jgi:hypothetical protein